MSSTSLYIDDTPAVCAHCKQIVPNENRMPSSLQFCCSGCQQVYEFIHEHDLSEFYQFENAGRKQSGKLKDRSVEKYRYLDSEESLSKYGQGDELRQMSFYVQDVHCTACLYLIEKLPELVEGVLSSSLRMSEKVVTLTLDDRALFSDAAYGLESLGYRPRPLEKLSDAQVLTKKEQRSALTRLAVAGFCARNIMLFSVGVYAGAEDKYQHFFT